MEEELQVLIDAAEQLEEIKKTLAQQQSYTTRLGELTNSISHAAAHIAKVPGALSVIYGSAAAVEQRVNAVALKVEELKNLIPGVIERIESSDVGRSIEILVTEIAGSRDDLKDFRKALVEVENISDGFRAANDTVFNKLSAEIAFLKSGQENVNSAIGLLRSELVSKQDALAQSVAESMATFANENAMTVKCLEAISNALKSSTVQQMEVLKLIRDDVHVAREKDMVNLKLDMEQQRVLIDALVKKKGFSF
ncbi:hypothetical protein [Massilia aquatica]|uniref:Uncharacterized protein n=1 Tax=Massilia aquatica TaxID=2609000 RepID=A0ABX0MJN1_9BURK|nr:hypothetical protein [Massilia aquatica]NHZ44610.1 hypothetical protein [Massilia aquatica]